MLARIGKRWIAALGVALLLITGTLWAWPLRMTFPSQSLLRAANAKGEEETATVGAADSNCYTNHLIKQKSPYLLMHAHNPVDWYPWGEEAFAKARREQKPIFLSVGYYTCHWCHVMERESFSDPSIAETMNKYFVSIKVDREERPDVDRVYMNFVVATTGSGGWPMSVFLTPDLKPFFGGTYYPREAFPTLLQRVAEAWQKNRANVLQSAAQVTQALKQFVNASVGHASSLQTKVLDKTYEQVKASYDPTYGGFGQAPKFPRPVTFNFLLRYYVRSGQKDALDMPVHTLRAMAAGGMHDQIGGGFHRYSTDATWHVPHFEKMLYDQAQLTISYLEAYQITHDPFFADTAKDILEFVRREMSGPEGAFYSALDADSLIEAGKPERGEGAFYVWKASEIEQILGRDVAAVFDFRYGVEPSGNVPAQQDIRGELKGKNVLIARHSLAETAKHVGKSESDTRALLDAAREKLFQVRARRPRPPLDDKTITAWNGLMISALARASQVLEKPPYLSAAERAANFVQSKLYDPKTGKLRRRYRAGETAVDGFLDDYAFFIQGLLDLYEASFDFRWFSWAHQLQAKQDQLFWDPKSGGYFTTSGADPSILMQTREAYDGAEPSPNSVAAMNLLRLWQMTDRKEWREKAEKTIGVFAARLEKSPEAMPQLVAALDFSLSRPKQIIIAGQPGAPDTRTLLRLVHERYIPNKILMLADGGQGQKQLAQWLPFIEGVNRKQGRATAYICENYVCKLPTADPQVAARLLDGKS